MTTPELSAAVVDEELELYRRMWVLRLLDMALEESRIDGLLNGPMDAAFGQEAVAVGTTAALRPGESSSSPPPSVISGTPNRSDSPFRWRRLSPR